MTELTYNGITLNIDELGAQLLRVYDSKTGTDYLWRGDPAIWTGHAYILWPFVGRLQDGKYLTGGKEYEMKIHGLARYSVFTVSDRTESSVTFTLESSEETKKRYPFDFVFSVKYSIDGNTLTEDAYVQNTGAVSLPYGFGGHPGFNVPLEEGLSFTDYYVEFPDAGEIRRDLFAPSCLMSGLSEETDTVSGKRMALRHDLFDNDAVVLRGTGYKAVIKSGKGTRAVEVEYPGATWCGVWHAVKKEAPYICIEPWWTLPGPDGEILDFDTAEGLYHLAPGETGHHSIVIKML